MVNGVALIGVGWPQLLEDIVIDFDRVRFLPSRGLEFP
jgi:hypothetical protein